MTDWLTRMISETTFDDPVETKVDSLDNVFKVKQTAELIGVHPESIRDMSDSALSVAADSVLRKLESVVPDTTPPNLPSKTLDIPAKVSSIGSPETMKANIDFEKVRKALSKLGHFSFKSREDMLRMAEGILDMEWMEREFAEYERDSELIPDPATLRTVYQSYDEELIPDPPTLKIISQPERQKDFLPIPEEIAALKEWGRDPFTAVGDALDAISDFRAESLAAETPISMEDAPEWFWDPQFDQENPNQIIESLE